MLGLWVLGANLSGCHTGPSPRTPEIDPLSNREVLPLVRVRLYESGVGYFERHGTLVPGRSTLPVPSGHLDDALKTLVWLDDEPSLSGVTFATRLSPAVARARAGLPANQETPLSYDRLLVALRGEAVELSLSNSPGTRVRGRVVDVVAVGPDHPSYDHGPPHAVLDEDQEALEEHERLHVLLLSDSGEIVRVDASDLAAVRPLDAAVAERLHAAMTAQRTTRSNQWQLLDLVGEARPLTLAYLAEAPVWRASYRLRLDDEHAQLQAWALVHNDTDEAWKNVRIELIHGRPSSFLFPVTAPRYERRDLQTPEQELSSVPQLSTTTPDAMWGDFSDYEGETVGRVGSEGLTGLGSGSSVGFGGGGGGRGYGARGKREPAMGDRSGSDLVWVGDLSRHTHGVAPAEATTPVFALGKPMDLPAQHSAMVPFLDAPLAVASVVWWGGFGAMAERAVAVNNTTSYILPAGPVAVVGGGGFLGEAMLDPLHPGDRQFTQIGDEPDVALLAGPRQPQDVPLHVDFREGQLRVHHRRTTTTRVSFRNQTGRPQLAYVALPVVTNASVDGTDDLDFETTSKTPLAVFHLAPGASREYVVTMLEAIRIGTRVEAVTLDGLTAWAVTPSIPERERDVLRQSVAPLQRWEAARAAEARTRDDIETLDGELTRLREDLKNVRSEGAAGAHAALLQRIFEREDQLARLQRQLDELAGATAERQAEFEAELGRLETFRAELLETYRRDAGGV